MRTSRPARSRRNAALRTVVGGLLAVGLSGCTIATSGSASSASTSAPAPPLAVAAPAGATVVVTVPQLAALGTTAASTSASTAVSSPSRPVTAVRSTSGRAGPTLSRPPIAADTSAVVTSAVATSATPTSAPATLSVQLANCPGCTVLGTHAGVTSTLGAALVATGPGRAALLALRADGSVAGVGNVVYGTTFPTQAGGQLACDSGGRCIVVAQQRDGTAIASAYRVSAQGVWAEVTGLPGIASVTAKALTLTVDGGVGVAVQDQADGTTVWIVYDWQGDGYGVKGCTAAATPDVEALTMSACLS